MAVVRRSVSEAQHVVFSPKVVFRPLTASFLLRHTWNIQNGTSNSDVGANIAEHAIVSLAEMMANNLTVQRPGLVPYLGTKLMVDWRYFAALMASIIVCDSLATVLGLMAI